MREPFLWRTASESHRRGQSADGTAILVPVGVRARPVFFPTFPLTNFQFLFVFWGLRAASGGCLFPLAQPRLSTPETQPRPPASGRTDRAYQAGRFRSVPLKETLLLHFIPLYSPLQLINVGLDPPPFLWLALNRIGSIGMTEKL